MKSGMPHSPEYCLEIPCTALKHIGLRKTYDFVNTLVWKAEKGTDGNANALLFVHTIVFGVLKWQTFCTRCYGLASQPPVSRMAGPPAPVTLPVLIPDVDIGGSFDSSSLTSSTLQHVSHVLLMSPA